MTNPFAVAGDEPLAPDDVRPPMPPFAPDTTSGLRVLLALQRNGLAAFPARCLSEPVIRLPLLGRRFLVLANDGPTVAEMLQGRAGDFERMPAARRILGPVVGRGLLTSAGEHWRRQRRAMAPAFTPRAMPIMAAHIARVADAGCRRLDALRDTVVDLFDEMQALSLEVAAVSMFSIEPSGFRCELRAMITDYMQGIGRPAPEDFLLPGGTPTPLALRRAAFRRRWRRLIAGVVSQRRGRPPNQARDLFDLLAQAHGSDADDLLIDEVATMLVAGHETTGLTLFWALHLLAQSPRWSEAVAGEAAGADLSPEGAADALAGLVQTQAVVQETLRLYSPAFMTARIAARNTSLGGCAVPKGSMVLAPFWLLHRDPARWKDPSRFDPSRFLGEATYDRSSFLPFGAGPHVCIGAQLAMTETVLVLARLLRDFRVTLAGDARPVLPVATLTTRPDHAPGFRLASRKRSVGDGTPASDSSAA